MAYTTIDNPELYFQTKLYTGNGSTQSITLDGSENMQPDWVWLKKRNGTTSNHFYDSVRGATNALFSDQTDATYTASNLLTAFNTDGFTVGNDTGVNNNSDTFVAWNWKAGGSASSNSNGSVTSTVSANTTAGFSIVSYSGSTNSTFTVGHGLGVVPKIFILKKRSSSGTNWVMYNANLGNDKRIQLNNTDAEASTTGFGSTNPTSSVFTVANGSTTGADGQTYIAYCFAEKKGYSKFGSYTGNGNADGTFVYTGFLPAWIMYKASSITDQSWLIHDNKRGNQGSNANPQDLRLLANATNTEADVNIDFLSNGFKTRAGDAHINSSGTTYIYMAFAESPFVNSNGVPNNAR